MASEFKRRKPGGLKAYGMFNGQAFALNSRGGQTWLSPAEKRNLIEMVNVSEEDGASGGEEAPLLAPGEETISSALFNIKSLNKKVFEATSVLQLESGTARMVANETRKMMGKPSLRKWERPQFSDKDFPFGQFVLLNITATHFMMSYMAEERREQFAFIRTEQLVNSLKIIFDHTTPRPQLIPDSFYEDLTESLYMSVLLSYRPESNKKYTRDYNLVGAYVHGISSRGLQNKLEANRRLCADTFLHNGMPKAERDSILRQVDTFNSEVLEQYKTDTRPVQKRLNLSLIIVIIAALATAIGYSVGVTSWWLFLPFSLGAAVGAVAATWYKNNREARELTGAKADSYIRTLNLRFDRIKKDVKASEEAKKEATSSRRTRAEKLTVSVRSHHQYLVNLPWKQWGIENAVEEARSPREEAKAQSPRVPTSRVPVYGLDYAGLSATSEAASSGAAPSFYDYGKAEAAYGRQKIKKAPPSRMQLDEVEIPAPTAEAKGDTKGMKSTYSQVTYRLDVDQQKRGFLGTGIGVSESSKGFFEFGDYKGLIDRSTKIKDGVWVDAFSSTKGEFGRLKYMKSLKQYELKLFDGQRLIFAQKEQQVTAVATENSGTTVNVPCWQPIRLDRK